MKQREDHSEAIAVLLKEDITKGQWQFYRVRVLRIRGWGRAVAEARSQIRNAGGNLQSNCRKQEGRFRTQEKDYEAREGL